MTKTKIIIDDNGLKVILSCDNSIPTVAINLCYHVGSKNEEPGKRGYAHLFEHLMFEGSKHVSPGEYDKIVTSPSDPNLPTCKQHLPLPVFRTLLRSPPIG